MVLSTVFYMLILYGATVTFQFVNSSDFSLNGSNKCIILPIDLPADANNQTCGPSPSICTKSRYRSFDGSCNNLRRPNWGAAMTPYARLTKSNFADGLHEMPVSVTGSPLPNARELSIRIFVEKIVVSNVFNLNAAQWGQIITHDMSLTAGVPQTNTPQICCNDKGQLTPEAQNTSICAPILVPPNDPVYNSAGKQCVVFERTTTTRNMGCTPAGVTAEPLSAVTAFMDLSLVYGNDVSEATSLRSKTGGRMLTLVRSGQEWPPQQSNVTNVCDVQSVNEPCYLAGDIRVNQNTQLTVLQVILLREHNRIAKELSYLNPHWNDEKLFQETRRILIAEIQHINYYEYLPILLGFENMISKKLIYPKAVGYVNDYDPNIDPSVLNEHATAAYRHFHTLIRGYLKLVAEDRKLTETIRLSDWMNKPLVLELKDNFDNLTRGLTSQQMSLSDQYWTAEVRDFLFRGNRTVGEDLGAIDIQRSRDHGLGTYVMARAACGLSVPKTFNDMRPYISQENIDILQSMYVSSQDVDLVVAGSLESHVLGALTGPTFFCILTEQFYRTRVGDRYFYENGANSDIAFTPGQLEAIRMGANMARLICDNADSVQHIQRKAFQLVSIINPIVKCEHLPSINLTQWKDEKPNERNIIC